MSGVSISIITICFNNLEQLITTCQSVDSQVTKPHEHIIVDGSTNKEISQYLAENSRPSYRKSKTEPDQGISDAFNKGIRRATGEVIHLLNSGDFYYDEQVLQVVTNTFKLNPDLKWLHGKYEQKRAGIWVISGKPFDSKKLYRGMRTIGHPTMFVRKELYEKFGMYDVKKKIAMDYDFLVRIRNEKFIFLAKPLTCFSPGGISSQLYLQGLAEKKESYRRELGNNLKMELWMFRLQMLHKLMQTPIGKVLFRLKNKLFS